ncbi:MAG: cytochrome c biogenesis CcdA family protein [Alphaproteobacteria bacterium]
MELIQEIMRQWYLLLSQASATLSLPLRGAVEQLPIPVFAVLLFGLIGAFSPCQLTTNLSAMAYVSRRPGERQIWSEALAYTSGKILVYTLFGGALIFLGYALEQSAIPIVIATRKIIGPLMIVMGLGFIGVLRLRGSIGGRLVQRLRIRIPQKGVARAFLLGAVFSFSFCPTLLWLFSGLMIPLALASNGGWMFPGVFAVGTALPLLIFAGLLVSGTGLGGKWTDQLKRHQRKVTGVSGAIFILAGVNDTLTYWLI